MVADSGVNVASLRADGGMTANTLLMQFQADLLDVQAREEPSCLCLYPCMYLVLSLYIEIYIYTSDTVYIYILYILWMREKSTIHINK